MNSTPNLNKFEKILFRFNISELAELIGKDLVETLENIDSKYVSANYLRKIFNLENNQLDVLKKTNHRNKFIVKLDEEEIKNLLKILDYKDTPSSNYYSFIESKDIQKSKDKFNRLLDFFNVMREDNSQEKKSSFEAIQIIKPQLKLRDYQVDIYNRTKQYLNSNKNRVLMHMPTGSGKTVTAMNLVAESLRNDDGKSIIVWLAHNRELCNQAASTFEYTWSTIGNKELSLQKHYGETKDYKIIDNGLFITSLSQLYNDLIRSKDKDKFVIELARKTKFIIFDEGHKAIAETYKYLVEVITGINDCGFLGLTATPGRSYLNVGEDIELAKFYHQQKVNIKVDKKFKNPIEFLQEEGFLSNVMIEPLNYESSESHINFNSNDTNLDLPDDFLNYISSDKDRNSVIIKKTISEFNNGGKILLFASSVPNAKLLNSLLNIQGLPSDIVTGQTPINKRSEVIKKFSDHSYKGILVNFDILTTGFDVPSADTAIIARPVNSLVLYSQMCGRVIRGPIVEGGTKNAKIIQVIDKKFGFRDLGEGFAFWDDLWENK